MASAASYQFALSPTGSSGSLLPATASLPSLVSLAAAAALACGVNALVFARARAFIARLALQDRIARLHSGGRSLIHSFGWSVGLDRIGSAVELAQRTSKESLPTKEAASKITVLPSGPLHDYDYDGD